MNDRIHELEIENKKLRDELAQKSDFISIMVHQLRTPISAMKWTFKMILDGDLGSISETQRKIIERGLHSSGQMIQLLADVSAANHASEWVMHMQIIPTDITPCLEGVIEEFAEEAKNKKIILSFLGQKPLPIVLADRDKLCLVVQNLLENAIKYNRDGGSVIIRSEVRGSNLIISIEDTGMGIPHDEQSQVFTKFFRAKNAQQSQKGTGLGLFIAKQIVDAHHGTTWFESNDGIGTTFFVSLPLAR